MAHSSKDQNLAIIMFCYYRFILAKETPIAKTGPLILWILNQGNHASRNALWKLSGPDPKGPRIKTSLCFWQLHQTAPRLY